MIEPFLEIIKVSLMYKEEKELHDRAQGLLRNKICHAREVVISVNLTKTRLFLLFLFHFLLGFKQNFRNASDIFNKQNLFFAFILCTLFNYCSLRTLEDHF